MSKFCGKCGSMLNENGLCPKCDYVHNQSENKQYTAIDSKGENVKKQRGKGKKAIKVVALILAVIIVAGGTVGTLTYFNVIDVPVISSMLPRASSNTTEKYAVIQNSYGNYYLSSYCIIPLDNLDSYSAVTYYNSEQESEKHCPSNLCKTAYDGEYFYAQEGDDKSNLYKYRFTDSNEMERTVWVDEDTLKNSVVTTDSGIGYIGNMSEFQADGDYIYFISLPSVEYLPTNLDVRFRLGRISKDGKIIEFIGDEIASSFTVLDGLIYFYDNGYNIQTHEIDESRAGIYKMKTDGTDKQLLLGNLEADPSDDIERRNNVLCDKLRIYDDKLFFINYSKEGQSRLCSIKTDGSKLEYITQKGVDEYTIDEETDTVYYTVGQYGLTQVEARSLIKASIGERKEELIIDKAIIRDPEIYFFDNYIYFVNPNQYHAGTLTTDMKNSTIGMRFDLNDKKADIFTEYINSRIEYDGIIPKTIVEAPVFHFYEDTDIERYY